MPIDNDEVHRFCKRPDFNVRCISSECDKAAEFYAEWYRCMDVDLLSVATLISSKRRSIKYSLARKRYLGLTKIQRKHEVTFPFFFLALAEAHFILSDVHGCQQALHALDILVPKNNDIMRLLDIISQLLLSEAQYDEEYHNQLQATHLHTFTSPFACPDISMDLASLQALQRAWETMQLQEKEAVMQYQRYACISSNVIEGVFDLEGHSIPLLIRKGFHINCIDEISLLSKQKQKMTIIRILENTQESLEMLSCCLDDYSKFTEDFIKKIHSTILQNDNFDEEEHEDKNGNFYSKFVLIPSGQYRQVACIATHKDGEEVTQFCRHSAIASEMDRYCTLAQNVLNNSDLDVFVKAAWLQWAFLRIHPFADGNGRVARVISSLPLAKLHLPPVAIAPSTKDLYFECLRIADRCSNILPLAKFLQDSIMGAIADIMRLPAAQDLHSTCWEGKTRTRRGDEFMSIK